MRSSARKAREIEVLLVLDREGKNHSSQESVFGAQDPKTGACHHMAFLLRRAFPRPRPTRRIMLTIRRRYTTVGNTSARTAPSRSATRDSILYHHRQVYVYVDLTRLSCGGSPMLSAWRAHQPRHTPCLPVPRSASWQTRCRACTRECAY